MLGIADCRLSIDGLAQAPRVLGFEGREAISELFEVQIAVACDDDAVVFGNVVGRAAQLSVRTEHGIRRFHGIVGRVEQGDEGEPLLVYRVTLVPLAYRLLLRRTSRVIEQLSAPDVVRRVLDLAAIPSSSYRFELHGKYAVREHAIQYRESDWAFVSRLLEEEGIFYFFEQGEDRCVLVIADTPFSHPVIQGGAAVPFRGPRGALAGGEHFTALRFAEQLGPARVTMSGYSYRHPSLPLASDLRADGDEGLVIHEHEAFDEPKTALAQLDQKARVTLETWQSSRRAAEGKSTCARLAAGSKVTVTEHPHDAWSGEYLITSVTHSTSGAGEHFVYSNRCDCIPSSVPFRPAKRTPKPLVPGVQTAIVVGPAGEEIHTDALGRVKVQLHWGKEGGADGGSSCWARVRQAWAGGRAGSLVIPRVGEEVVVDFIEGDIDRLLVIGSVSNGVNLPPYTLPGDRTVSGIRSSSVPGGSGANELRIDDQAGAEEVYVHAQRNLATVVENDEERTIRHDATLSVGGDRSKSVQGSETEEIGADRTARIGGDRSEQVGGKEWVQVGGTSSKTVASHQSETTGANRTMTVGQNHTEVVGQNLSVMVGATRSESVGHDSAETVGADKRASVAGTYRISVGGPMITEAESAEDDVQTEKTVRAGTRFEIASGKSRVIIEASGKIVIEGDDVEIRSAGPVKVQGTRLAVKATGPVQIKSAGRVDIKGKRIEVN